MLPVIAGRTATTWQILIYSGLPVLASEFPWALGFAGAIYGATVGICGALFLLLALQLNMSTGADRRPAHRLLLFSISYLFVLFAVLLSDHYGGGSFSLVRRSRPHHPVRDRVTSALGRALSPSSPLPITRTTASRQKPPSRHRIDADCRYNFSSGSSSVRAARNDSHRSELIDCLAMLVVHCPFHDHRALRLGFRGS
jgi:hypothetical protein